MYADRGRSRPHAAGVISRIRIIGGQVRFTVTVRAAVRAAFRVTAGAMVRFTVKITVRAAVRITVRITVRVRQHAERAKFRIRNRVGDWSGFSLHPIQGNFGTIIYWFRTPFAIEVIFFSSWTRFRAAFANKVRISST